MVCRQDTQGSYKGCFHPFFIINSVDSLEDPTLYARRDICTVDCRSLLLYPQRGLLIDQLRQTCDGQG